MTLGLEHYLYVLRCADGSYYTGYTTNVSARVAAHNAGRGAKCTRSRLPVELVASARFFTKERAMSAEYRFKQLSRQQKDALLAQAGHLPFEEVLATGLPGFAPEPVSEFVARSLWEHRDDAYRAFQSPLIPSVPAERMVGVRTPQLRSLAAQLARREDVSGFYDALPHRWFEEDQLHAFAIARERDYPTLLAAYEGFLPFVDNWATCDQLPTAPLMRKPDTARERALTWMRASHAYTARFGMGVLMRHFLKERFEPQFLTLVADVHAAQEGDVSAPPAPGYYVNMMRAWFFAEALAHQQAATLPWLEGCAPCGALDEWTRKKAVRKALESRKIAAEVKEHLRSLA